MTAKKGIAAKAFIVNKDNELLIVKRTDEDEQSPGVWEIPGGRVTGEDPEEGLIREVIEETSLEVEVIQPLNMQKFTRDDGIEIVMLIYLCKPKDDKDKEIILSEEHTDSEWVPIENSKGKLGKFFHNEVEMFQKQNLNRFI